LIKNMHQSPPDSQTLIKNEGTDCELVLQKILDTTADTAIIQLNKPNTVAPPLGTTILLGHIGEYEFHMGIPESAIPQIQAHALDISDEALQKNTSDFKRFSTQEKLEKWYYDPGRYVFVLMAQDTVAGIWFGRPCELPYISHGENRELIRELEAHPDLIHTSGVRIYPAFRGQ